MPRIFKNIRYGEEADRLAVDPIIVAMADELRADHGDFLDTATFESWDFIRSADDEYRARGGWGSLSIGGPAEGVKRAYAQLVRGEVGTC